MDLNDAVRARRMVRSFSGRPVPDDVLERLLHGALRAPSAGNTAGTSWVVLVGEAETRRYWDAATTGPWRARSRRWPGLAPAPVVALALCAPQAYVARYAEPDKTAASTDLGLGTAAASWPVPYWFGDAAFGVMTLLLGATAEGLGACFLGNFRAERDVLGALGVPSGWRLFGTVVLGYPGGDDPRSGSLDRRRPDRAERLHRGGWGEAGTTG